MTADVTEVVDALRFAGFDADFEHPPTVFAVTVADDGGRVLFTEGFNRGDGEWEAVLDYEGNQTPLLDGPGADCTTADLAVWATALAVSPASYPG